MTGARRRPSTLEGLTLRLILSGIGAIVVISGFVGVMGVIQGQADERSRTLVRVQLDEQSLKIGMVEQQAALRAFVETANPGYLGQYRSGRLRAADAMSILDSGSAEPLLRPHLAAAAAAARRWETWAEATKTEVEVSPGSVSQVEIAAGDAAFDGFRAADDTVEAEISQQADQATRSARTRRVAELSVIGGGGLFGAAVLVLLGRTFGTRILRPITVLSSVARRISEGEDADIPAVGRDPELAELESALRGWKQAMGDLEHQALYDSLTGLPNRKLLADRMDVATREADRAATGLALVLIDLDRFKHVNDTLGHHRGDLLLVEIGGRLRDGLRASDTVARLGGDEFALVLPGVTEAAVAEEVAAKLVAQIDAPVDLEGERVAVTASAGVALYPSDARDSVNLLRRADVAMYSAKAARTGVALYDARMDAGSHERLQLATDLREAVERDEFVVHYQPEIDVRTRALTGVEALVRWNHPLRGLLGPEHFIPAAEESGAIRQVALKVMRQAFAQQRTWREQGAVVRVAINLSAHNVLDPEFPPTVVRLVQAGLDPALVKFEITESVLMADPEAAVAVLGRLRGAGFSVAIDDFGTGHSSLAYLRRLPVDELKIDKSFVMNMSRVAADAAIVRMSIELARAFGLATVAEGVEDEGTLARLEALGCDRVQGYLVAPPLPAATVLEAARLAAGARPALARG